MRLRSPRVTSLGRPVAVRLVAVRVPGLELVEHARAMGDAASRLLVVAAGQSLSLKGVVCIAASEAVAVYMLTPIISGPRLEYPGIEIEIVASISVSDLLRRESDIAIRNFRPTEPDLVARKLWTSQARYAAPGYLERIGNPGTPAELSRAEFMGFDRGDVIPKDLNALGLDLTGQIHGAYQAQHLGGNRPIAHVGTAVPRHRDRRRTAQVARFRYILSQGCPGGLVASPRDWPGVHCATPLTAETTLWRIWRIWTDRSGLYEAKRCGRVVDPAEFECLYPVRLFSVAVLAYAH